MGCRGRAPKKGPKKWGKCPPKKVVDVEFGRFGVGPRRVGGEGVWVLEEMEGRGRQRCVRYGGQTTTDDDAACVRCVYGWDSGGGSHVM